MLKCGKVGTVLRLAKEVQTSRARTEPCGAGHIGLMRLKIAGASGSADADPGRP